MIKITESADGVVISVRAQPGAKRTAIVGAHGEALKVAVQAPPVDGKANAALEEALAEWLGIRKSRVAIRSGVSSRDKTFAVSGIGATAVRERLANHLPPA